MNNYQQKTKKPRQYKTIECPYCGGELLSSAKKCKHCGELLTKSNLMNTPEDDSEITDIIEEENTENVVALGPVLTNIGGILCYIFAVADYVLGSLGVVDLTGFSWSPILFSVLGLLLQALAKTVSE